MVFTSRWPSSFPAVRFVFTAPKSKQMKWVCISDSREDKNKSCFQQTRAERGVNVSSSGGQKLKVNRQLIVNQPIVPFHWQEHTDEIQFQTIFWGYSVEEEDVWLMNSEVVRTFKHSSDCHVITTLWAAEEGRVVTPVGRKRRFKLLIWGQSHQTF